MLRSVAPACLISGLHRSRRGQPPVRVPYLFELVCRLYPYQRLQPDKNGRIPLHLILTLRRRLSSSLGDNPLVAGSGGALNNFRWTHTDDVYIQWVMLSRLCCAEIVEPHEGLPPALLAASHGASLSIVYRLIRAYPLLLVCLCPRAKTRPGPPSHTYMSPYDRRLKRYLTITEHFRDPGSHHIESNSIGGMLVSQTLLVLTWLKLLLSYM